MSFCNFLQLVNKPSGFNGTLAVGYALEGFVNNNVSKTSLQPHVLLLDCSPAVLQFVYYVHSFSLVLVQINMYIATTAR